MKLKFTSLVVAAASALGLNGQVLLQEDFTSPFNPATNGWTIQNLSTNTSTNNWFQGNPAVFTAFSGANNDYIGSNFQASTGASASDTLSVWLITPTLNLQNGFVLEYATRTVTNPAAFADRMQVRMSTAGAASVTGSESGSLGSFTTILQDINPNLTLTGYPGTWTVYSHTLSGLASPTVGRFAFRYYVNDLAANSNYIGLDAVKYSAPAAACAGSLPNYTICTGSTATLMPMNVMSGANYTWNPGGSNSSSLVVTPGATTTYTLTYEELGTVCPDITSTVTIGSQLSVSVSASSSTICSASSVTLMAHASATTYSWNTGATTASIVVNPTTTTTYSVGALNGLCLGGNTVNITVLPRPSLSVNISPSPICANVGSVTISLSGANTYTFLGNNNATQSLATPTAAGTYSFLAGGSGINGCTSVGAVFFTVNPTPTVSVVPSASIACTNTNVTLTASGANTYTWSSTNSPTVNPLTVGTGSTAGTHTYMVVGTNTAGCSASSQMISITVTVCNTNTTTTGISSVNEIAPTTIYPNPFNAEIRINQLDGSVEVFNALGQIVISAPVNGSAVLKTTDLAKGVYVVKTYNTSGELVKTSKLMKH
jgi:hypothetical protein